MNHKQLFCLTYAGGTASFFDVIEEDLNKLEIIKLEYSGHGERRKESLYSDFDELADDLYNIIKAKYAGYEYGLFGYSMGSISLTEVLKRIELRGEIPLPIHVFIAAHEPFTKEEPLNLTSKELDEWVKRRTLKFGGVPEELIENNAFWRVYLPLYKADYMIIAKYKFERLDYATNVPTTVFYSPTDTSLKDMEKWKKYYQGICEFFKFDGSHFFIQQHHEEIARIISYGMDVKL